MSKKSINPDDVELFRQAIGKVQPLRTDQFLLKPASKPKPYPKNPTVDLTTSFARTIDFEIENLSHEDLLSFTAPGLQKNVLKKMRRGVYGLDAELDLHGLNSREAKQQLVKFLHHCVEDGCRCVHIIHGKGYRSPDQQPILKNKMNLWLRQHQDVQAFCSAARKDGGTGAVYVLLRLSKKYREQEDT
jgi:DNA-nicking Smr family endonuclease